MALGPMMHSANRMRVATRLGAVPVATGAALFGLAKSGWGYAPPFPTPAWVYPHPDSVNKFLVLFGLARVCVCKIVCGKGLAADSSKQWT
jgi:hypothetical protein